MNSATFVVFATVYATIVEVNHCQGLVGAPANSNCGNRGGGIGRFLIFLLMCFFFLLDLTDQEDPFCMVRVQQNVLDVGKVLRNWTLCVGSVLGNPNPPGWSKNADQNPRRPRDLGENFSPPERVWIFLHGPDAQGSISILKCPQSLILVKEGAPERGLCIISLNFSWRNLTYFRMWNREIHTFPQQSWATSPSQMKPAVDTVY